MARVVVTGGAGKLGRACVDELIRHGWDVVVFDRVRPPSESGAEFIPIDLTDYGQVLDAMLGVEERYARPDALVHLAAVPAPGRAGPPDLHEQHRMHLECPQRGAPCRDNQHRLGLQRNRARAAVRRPSALHPGGRGISAAARVHLFPGQDA
jgi:NAD(P)-dependent dehydrogenase (short-subunit alcohol dehydrogenase family)